MSVAPFRGAVGLIAAAGTGERLGLGPKAFLVLNGQTLLERAVAVIRPHVDAVVVAVPPGCETVAGRLDLAGARVVPGGADRLETMRSLVEATAQELLVLHDVVHPLVDGSTVAAVLAAARRHGAAAAVATLEDNVLARDGSHMARAGEALLHLKPTVVRHVDLLRALQAWDGVEQATPAAVEAAGRRQPGMIQLLERIGVRVFPVTTTIPHLKLSTKADWDWLRRLVEGTAGRR